MLPEEIRRRLLDVGDVTEVVVGITPHCPYGFPGCWAGAKEALENLDDMLIVASTPDRFNCTARVSLKRAGLPDLVKWPKQFNSMVGQAHSFRGVEVTVMASVVKKDGQLILKTPGLKQEITLAPLQISCNGTSRKTLPGSRSPMSEKRMRNSRPRKIKRKGTTSRSKSPVPSGKPIKELSWRFASFSWCPQK